MSDHVLDMAGAPLSYDAVVTAHRIAWTEGLKVERIRYPPGLLDGVLDWLGSRSTPLGPPADINQIVTTYGVLKLEEDHEADPRAACLVSSDEVAPTVKIINIGDCVDPCPCGVRPDHEKGSKQPRDNLRHQFMGDKWFYSRAYFAAYQTHIDHGGSWWFIDYEGRGVVEAVIEQELSMKMALEEKISLSDAAKLEHVLEMAEKTGGLIVIDTISEEVQDGET